MKINRPFLPGAFLVALLVVIPCFARLSADDSTAGGTFMVKNGAFPWSDRVNGWQLADVPASIDGNGPLPQQSCGSRMIALPDGAKYILLGVATKDVEKFKTDYPDAKPTGDATSVVHPDGTGAIPYTIFKILTPAASVGDKDFLAGLLLLQINDKPAAVATPATNSPPAPGTAK